MVGEKFSAKERIKSAQEFRTIIKYGKRVKGNYFTIVALENKEGARKIAISVSKKAGSAVFRNRIKRKIREIFRRNKEIFPEGAGVIFIIKEPIKKVSFSDLKEEVCTLLAKLIVQKEGKSPFTHTTGFR